MIKNLTHAVLGATAFLGLAWLVTQPAQVKWMAHNRDVRETLAAALVILALFVVVCLVKAFRPAKAKQPQRPATPYAAPARRR
jgi:uncharacterized membrane-anchored protein